MRPVSGLAILSLNPSLQMKLTDDYAAGNTDAHKSPVDERYRLFSSLERRVATFVVAVVSFLCMGLSLTRCVFALRSSISVLVFSSILVAQSTLFVGTWRPPHWKTNRQNHGIVFHIVQNEHGLGGTVHFYDPRSDHESIMLNPILSERTFAFDTEDDYLKGRLSFSMTVEKSGKNAVVKGSGGEMLLDFKLVKQP